MLRWTWNETPIHWTGEKTPNTKEEMSSVNLLNPKAEYMKKQQAMAVQITAATGMQEVLKTNLGTYFHWDGVMV